MGDHLCLLLIVLVLNPCIADGAIIVDAYDRAMNTFRKQTAELTRKRSDNMAEITIKELFQLRQGESLHVTDEVQTAQGTTLRRLQEEYHGIPVLDAVVTVESDNNDQLTGDATGRFIQEIDTDVPSTYPKLSKDQALHTVQINGDTPVHDFISDVEITLYIYVDQNVKTILSYLVCYLIVTEDVPKRPAAIIDANTGHVLKRWNALDACTACMTEKYTYDGGNIKTGKIKYGKAPFCLDMKIEGDYCQLENEKVSVVDLNKTSYMDRSDPVRFRCEDGYDDSVNGGFSPALDAYFYGNIVYRMFNDWFMTDPLPSRVVLKVHYGNAYQDAFWTGRYVVFGDGNYTVYPLVDLDVVAHEIAHGVTQRFSGLIYTQQSGGINEAFSDIIGEAAEEFFSGTDLRFGFGITKDKHRAIRYFSDPAADGYSVAHVDDYDDSTDVHHSSGIFRRVFYVVTKEEGMRVRDAALVFLQANRMYWHEWSTFISGACDVLKSAYDLGFDLAPFEKGFKDVGIEPCKINQHILGLKFGKLYSNITVSDNVAPVFSYSFPSFLSTHDYFQNASLIVNSTSNSGEIGIKLTKCVWNINDCDESSNVISIGITSTSIKLLSLPSIFYITLFQVYDRRGSLNDVTVSIHCFIENTTC